MEEIVDESSHCIALFLNNKFYEEDNAVTCIGNLHSVIKLHLKHDLKIEDGQKFESVKDHYAGNPQDSIEVVELVNGVANAAKKRRDTTRRAVLISIVVLNK